MLKNYLTSTIRNLKRDRLYSFINIGGLTLGIAGAIFCAQYIVFENSYDKDFENSKNIYRVTTEWFQEGKFLEHRAAAVPAMQQMFQSSFPEVINYARYHKAATSIVRYVADNRELKFEENEIYFADSEFLDIFDVNLTKGNVSSALNAPNKMIISESMANKYFGDVNPIGKRLLFNGSYAFECEVSGVMSDFKVNTHLAGDFIISLSTKVNLVPMFNIPDNWIWRSFYTYIVVKDLKNVSDLEEKINNNVSQRLGSFYEDRGYKVNYHVQRLEEIHLNSNLFEEIKQNGNSRNLKYLGFIGSFMLLIAIFNYINLSTAKNLKRAKEVGVRKTVGAETSNLKVQFLLESVVVNGIAFILAVLSLWLFFELVVNFLNVTIRFTLLSNLWFWILFFLAWLTISILSGIYPAFILSGLRPVKVMSGSFKSSSGNILFRKALVIMQVCVALGLIIYLLAMFSQIRFMRDRELGIDKENILVVQGPKIKNEAYLSNLEFFKNNIEKDNDFLSMSTVSSLPGEVTGAGRDFRNQSGVSQFLRIIRVEYGFEKVFGLQVLSGNTFSADRSANNSGLILNRLAADKIGVANLQDAIGTKLSWTNTEENITSEIVGVLDNYLPDSQSEAVPTVFILNRTFSAPWDPEYYTIKFADSGNTSVTSKIDKVNSIWERVFPSDPFLYYFVDDFFELQFSSSRNFMRAISMFSILSILIALIGVLALSSYTNQMKSKEIGIRKVLGAEIKDILLLLIKQYSKLLGIATVVTIIVVYFILENWLRTFSYRMVLSPGLFVIPAFLLFIFILSLITYQSYSSAIVNPVKVLKKE